MTDRLDRALGAFYGLALGDALGMPTQVMSRQDVVRVYGAITGFASARPDNPVSAGMPAGSVTDDTEQAVLVGRLLVEGDGRIDPLRLARELLDCEREMKAKGSFDLSPVLARTDWLSANAREARLMTGHEDPRSAAAALGRRLAPGAGVLVRADKDGCWLTVADQPPVHVPGFPVTAIDSNGAGDAHVGAFLALLAEGLDPVTAARGANAAAACAVTRRGPATAPDRAELAAFRAGDPLAERLSLPRGR
ncbi:PfkB family carbohydrate kinase [Streptomyces sp. NPDC051016]|uniref:PfkB family carbohydrate kinase n=1 Tax=Streptomyces sp. NPDC051016 TaxID=3365638 RepID=UPI0037B15C37